MNAIRLIAQSTALVAAMSSSYLYAASLSDIYQQAVSNDPQLKIARSTSLAGQEGQIQAKANLLPQIGLSADIKHIDSGSVDYDNHGYTLTLSQPVFDASTWYGYKQSEHLSEQARLEFSQSEQTLILRAVQAYLDVLRAKTTLETNQAQERAIKRRLDQVNAQFEVGLIAITDVQEAQASYDNARVARIEAEGALDNSYEAIERLTGNPITDIDILHKDYPIQSLVPAEPKPWLEKAWTNNFEIQLANSRIEAQRRALQSAESGHLPTVSLDASIDSDSGNSLNNDTTRTNMIALTVRVPLFSGGRTSSQIRQSEHTLNSTQQSREDTLRDVTQKTRSLLRDLRTNVLSVAARKQSIKSSETALKATEEGFKVGTRNVVDVLQAEQTLYAAQRDYANARYNYVQNLFSLKQQVGTLNPEDVSSLDKWLVAP